MGSTKRIEHGAQLIMSGEVDEKMFSELLQCLDCVGYDNPFQIILNTEGGDLLQAIAIYEELKKYTELEIIVKGACMSAGITILMAAKIRKATHFSQFLIHYGEETNTSGSDKRYNDSLFDIEVEIIKSRVKATIRTVRNWCAGETYFTSEQALKKGLINEVIPKS